MKLSNLVLYVYTVIKDGDGLKIVTKMVIILQTE